MCLEDLSCMHAGRPGGEHSWVTVPVSNTKPLLSRCPVGPAHIQQTGFLKCLLCIHKHSRAHTTCPHLSKEISNRPCNPDCQNRKGTKNKIKICKATCRYLEEVIQWTTGTDVARVTVMASVGQLMALRTNTLLSHVLPVTTSLTIWKAVPEDGRAMLIFQYLQKQVDSCGFGNAPTLLNVY